jgi:hypothetical protein
LTWPLTTEAPEPPSAESHLEQSFRTVFTSRVTGLGATVKESPGPHGNRLTITFPNATRQWILDPQVLMAGCKPDFVLSSSQPSLPPVAIFTDGKQYHASLAHNRIADDAQKRRILRDGGNIVVAITARDVEQAGDGGGEAPSWFHAQVAAELMSSTVGFGNQNLDAIKRGPIDQLLGWIQNPDLSGTRALARHLPMMFAVGAMHLWVDPAADLSRDAADRLAHPARRRPGDAAPPNAWWWTAGPVGCLTRVSGNVMETALVIDDRSLTVGHDYFADAWREWLRIANALNLRDQPTSITSVTELLSQAVPSMAPSGPGGSGQDLPSAWQVVLASDLNGEERELASKLARYQAVPIPVPKVGYEVIGIPIDFAWEDKHIAVCLDLDDLDRNDLEAEGWRCVPADPAAVADALNGDR